MTTINELAQGEWADLFEDLSDEQSYVVRQGLASIHHEGWEPDRALVVNLVDLVSGRITEAEYAQRARARVQ